MMSKFRNEDIERLAGMLKALASPQRLRLFVQLTDCCEPERSCTLTPSGLRRCVGDLARDVDLSASTVSHHLKELRQSGVLKMQRSGQRIQCWVSEEAVRLLAEFFAAAVRTTASGRTGSPGDCPMDQGPPRKA